MNAAAHGAIHRVRRLPLARQSQTMIWRVLAACMSLTAAHNATAQVHGPGPSDSALFDAVINLPPAPSIHDNESVGGVASQTTQLNVAERGRIGEDFSALSGAEVNISGGIVGDGFTAKAGSEINISGGGVGGRASSFKADAGSVVNLSGGSIENLFALDGSVVNITGGVLAPFGGLPSAFSGSVVNIDGGAVGALNARAGSVVTFRGGSSGHSVSSEAGSHVELIGGEFMLNGAPYSGPTITMSDDDVFTGTLADGSAFIFSREARDQLTAATLTRVALPMLVGTPIEVDASTPLRPSGLRAGQTLTLQSGGSLGNYFEVVDATLNVEGGSLGDGAGAQGSVVNISGGNVGYPFDQEIIGSEEGFAAYDESVVNISGGDVRGLTAFSGSSVRVSGGHVSGLSAESGSEVNVAGGSVGLQAHTGSEVHIRGGRITGLSIGRRTNDAAEVEISGGAIGRVSVYDNSALTISGGRFEEPIDLDTGSVVNISGGNAVDFLAFMPNSEPDRLDPAEINLFATKFHRKLLPPFDESVYPLSDSLAPGEVYVVPLFGAELIAGILADGTPFELDTSSYSSWPPPRHHPRVTVTLVVPEPAGLALAVLGATAASTRRRRR